MARRGMRGKLSWDPMGDLAPAAVSGFEAVIHLAGESVVGRWTPRKRRRSAKAACGVRKV